MKSAYDIIIRPIVTEHSMDMMPDRKYTFEVAKSANKIEIKKAVTELFGVEVENVTTMIILGKVKRTGKNVGKRPDWKKATVRLTPNSKTIEFFDGLY